MIEHVTTAGVFSLDGQDFDVENNIWLIGAGRNGSRLSDRCSHRRACPRLHRRTPRLISPSPLDGEHMFV
jgi:hypothetical protein